MTGGAARGGPLGLLAALALLPAVAHASPASDSPAAASTGRRVLLVTSDLGADIAPAVVTRLRGELRAARFEMDVATVSADAPRRATIEELAAREGTSAALGIFLGGDRVEMWASDASASRTLMQNLALDAGTPDRRATIVAVKAVDLLKATLAEIWTAPPAPGEPPIDANAGSSKAASPPVAVIVEPPAEGEESKHDGRFTIVAGAGWLDAGSVRGWAPLIALSAALGSGGLAARSTLSALGSIPDVATTAGTAELAQQIGLAELVLSSRAWHRLRGALSIGVGTHHLSVTGHGAPGFAGADRSVWSAATAAGAGAAADLLPWLVVALDVRAVENWPATAVHIDGAQVARIGRPIIWVALAAGVRFR